MTQFVDEPIVFNSPSTFNILPRRNIDKLPVGITVMNVANIEHFTTHNTGAITVTEFAKGYDGQEIVILGDSFTTVQENATIVTNQGDILLQSGFVYRFVNFGNVWYLENGGGVPVPLIVEGSVALDKIAYFHNTNAVSGYGIRIQNDGPVTNYAFKISDATGAGVFHGYGRPVIHLGPEGSTQINSILGGTSTNSFISIEGMNGVDNQAGIIMRAGSFNIVSMLYQTGGDGGMRLAWNYKEPYVAGNSYGNDNYPQIQMSWETDGAFGLEYSKPYITAPGAYDSLPGKSWKLYGAGNPGVTVLGRKDKYIFMAVCEPGRGFDFGVETAGTGSGYGTRLRIDDSSNADPIYGWFNGALRQVKSKDFTALAAGDKVLYYN